MASVLAIAAAAAAAGCARRRLRLCWWLLCRRVHLENALREAPLSLNAEQLVLDRTAGEQNRRAAALVQQAVRADLGGAHTVWLHEDVAGQVAVAGGQGLAALEVVQDGRNSLDCAHGGDDLLLCVESGRHAGAVLFTRLCVQLQLPGNAHETRCSRARVQAERVASQPSTELPVRLVQTVRPASPGGLC